ncbi:MAG: DUF2808 domain-containing protein [Synechocystis sp.]|nr:DUF2808 domain-containing protein [Synechocystis sp.]
MMTGQKHQGKWISASNLLKLGLGLGLIGGLVGGNFFSRWPGSGKSLSHAVLAQELPGGISFFSDPPQLTDSETTFNGVSIPTPKYYFTIALPNDAGASLAKVVFQRQDSPDPIEFYPDRSAAFDGDRQNLGQPIPLQTTLWDQDTGRLTISFAEPVAPGQTVTIRLIPIQNPDVPGVYQFRLFAFPTGSNVQSIDLGIARFQFYRGIW